MARQIREALQKYLQGEEGEPLPHDPIWDLPELAKTLPGSGLGDASVDLDRYLYQQADE